MRAEYRNTLKRGRIHFLSSAVVSAFLLVASSLQPPSVGADPIHDLVGTTAGSVLRIGNGPRAVAMGGAFCAVADDGTALSWNPAGLGLISGSEVVLSREGGPLGLEYDHFGVARRVGPRGALGGQITLVRVGETEAYDANDSGLGPYSASSAVVLFGYGRNIRRKVSLGVGWKGTLEEIAEVRAVSYALDAGLLVTPVPFLATGLVVQNMGPPARLEEESRQLPFVVRWGWSCRLWGDGVLLSGQVDWPRDEWTTIRFGTEINLVPRISLRGGVVDRLGSEELDYHTGMGLDFTKIRLDYSFSRRFAWAESHYASLTILF